MPRGKVIGWTLIACGVIARFALPYYEPPNDRAHSAMYAFYVFLVFALGSGFVAIPVLRQFLFAGGQRTDQQVNSERWGCLGIVMLAFVMLFLAFTLLVP